MSIDIRIETGYTEDMNTDTDTRDATTWTNWCGCCGGPLTTDCCDTPRPWKIEQ